jgi:hypothetical protein
MLDILMTMGQAASALLLIYGGYLVLVPKKPLVPMRSAKLQLLQRHA